MELPACDLLYADACALAAHSLKNAQIITVPLTWNSMPPAVLSCDSLSLSLSTFKSRLKTRLFSTAFC